MSDTNVISRRISALAVILLAAALLLRWMFHSELIAALIPGSAMLGPNTPLMFIGSGALLYVSTLPSLPPSRRRFLLHWGPLLVAALAGLILLENLVDIDLGIDWRGAALPTPETPHPGRVAPNTCIAFLLSSLALWLAGLPSRSRAQQRLMIGAVVCVMIIAAAGLVGHFMALGVLYRLASYNRMLLPTALGLAVLSIGLWFLLQHVLDGEDDSVPAYERRITRRAAGIMAAVAVSTGVAGFAVIESGFEASLSQNLVATTVANAAALSATLDSRLWLAASMNTRPSVLHAFAALTKNPNDAAAPRLLSELGASLVNAGIDKVRFLRPDGSLILEVGHARASAPVLQMAFSPRELRAALAWQDGFFLQTESNVVIDETFVGKIEMEQALPAFENLIAAIERSSASTEILICGRTATEGLCAPSRFYQQPRKIALFNADGSANAPRVPRNLNQVSTMRIKDLRGVASQVVYTPLQNFGLGMVMKVDSESLLSPLRDNVSRLALIVIGLVGLGTLMLRLQVMPLLAKVSYEQMRNRVILANSNDAFVAVDSAGRITDWNARAESLFQLPVEEALGRRLSEFVMAGEAAAAAALAPAAADAVAKPAAERTAPAADPFAASADAPAPGRTADMLARRADGSLFPVELSVTGFHDGRSHIANAFIRDTTDRKKAEALLADRERFLRAITDTLPALIGYVNAQEIYEFANLGYKTMLGLEPEAIVGKSIREVAGHKAYPLLKPNIDAALAGRATHFEQALPFPQGTRYLLVDYLPKFDGDTVVGFYIMVLEVTERKRSELALAQSEERLRAVSDNLPALITHIDNDERYLFVNAHVERVFGVPAGALVGKTMREVAGNKLYADLVPHIRAALSGTPRVFEGVAEAKGRELIYEATYVPEYGPDGAVIGFFALTFDITERRENELLLARSEARIRLITDNLPVLISYIDRAHCFQFGNATFKAWLGVDPAQFTGKPIAELIGEEAYAQRRAFFDRALAGETVRFDMKTTARGVERVLQTTYVPQIGDDGKVDGIYTLSNDVSSLKAVEAELEKLATVDSLTGLPNRRRFEERMEEAISRSKRSGTPMALLFLDIDHFKQINDTLGHAAGDDVLRQFAKRLKNSVRKTDLVARLAGDEFVVILDGFKSPREIELIGKKIVAAARKPMLIDGQSRQITVSIGGAALTPLDSFMETVMARADQALYAAKKAGRDGYKEWSAAYAGDSKLPL